MMGPLPPPPPDRPELPRVRLEVRTGSGRSVSYEVGSDEFLIGGASGCDLRLPTPNLPPVVCQLTRKPDGVKVRRLAPGLPVLLNGHPLPSNTATAVADADTLSVAGLDVTVGIQFSGYVSPKLVPLDPTESVRAPSVSEETEELRRLEARQRELEAEERARRAEWGRQDAELVRRQRELDQQTEELETDRVLWYRRRQEIEQELERVKALPAAPPPEVAQKQAQLAAWEQELGRVRDELTGLREEFLRQYQERRDQLTQMQEAVRDGNDRLQADRQALDAELAERTSRAESEAAEKLRQADEESARRKAAVEAELAESESRLAEIREQRERVAASFQELARQRELFAADRDIFEKARGQFETERAAELDRLVAREAALSAREAEFVHRQEAFHTESEAFAKSRQELQEDLLRLERRRAVVEEHERDLENRTREAEARFELLRKDAAEWEETVRLASADRERLRAEAERLDRQKAELDAQTAKLTERAAQLEAQQAVLAVLRAKLDRTRADVEREATALAAARVREEEAQAELRARIQEAEQLRAELNVVQESAAQERRRLDERDSLLTAGLDEIRTLKELLAAEELRLRQREAELDVRAAEFAEQAGAMKGRMSQALDLQARLEADRVAIREREAALASAEEARQALQEQLRRRAEDLAARGKAVDELTRQLAADRTALDQERAALAADRQAAEERVGGLRAEIEARVVEVERQTEALKQREAALARQVSRVKEVGAAVAAERKAVAEARSAWETDRTAAETETRKAKDELEAFRSRVAAELEALRSQAPQLDEQARAALERLSVARDLIRDHLSGLNEFARQSRDDLDAVRLEVHAEADRIREQQAALDRAKAEHRLAVTAFRQQLVEWQGRVAEMKRGLAQSESRLDAKQAAVDEAARQVDATSQHLAEEAERLRREREEVTAKRTEMERHLADMREWYRRKLREIAGPGGEVARSRGGENPPVLKLHDTTAPPHHPAIEEELNPGDRQLGELLRSLELVDADTLTALWTEAAKQRRTLRQVLLASGAVTLYQLALIEAGNLDGLMLGRFRVIDRLRSTPRETIYRVFDPTRADAGSTRGLTAPGSPGVFLLRHLAEAEMHDAVHPDEFRQRFAAARDATHSNLAAVVEVLEVNGRPAVLEEWLTGLFSADWPAHAAHPGCWVRLMTMAAAGLEAAHRAGLVHGRLTSDSFVLTAAGVLKLTQFGEPPWLAPGPMPHDPTPAADLRALGQVAFGWSQLAGKKRGTRPKPFPAELVGVIRRLEADAGPPMADTVASDRPYESAGELAADLKRIAQDTPFSDDAWEKLLRHVADNAPEAPAALRQSA
jgi:chromosome segregation ATPase